MPPKIQISNWQAVLLTLFASISTTIIYIPGEPIAIVGQDAWIAVIIGAGAAALFLYYPLADLGSRFPGQTIIEYSETILGKYLGKISGVLFAYYFFQLHCWTLREFGELSVVILPETPLVVFMIALSLAAVWAVYSGLEVIGRCAEFVFPLGMLSLLLIVLAGIVRMDFSNLLPVMDNKILLLIRASISTLDWLTIGVVFGIISAYIPKKEDLKKVGFMSSGIAGIFLTVFSVVNILIMGVPILSVTNIPLLGIAKQITIPSFERIELFVIVLWITWIFVRAALFTFAAVVSVSQLFRLKDFRCLIVVETVLAISYAGFQYNSINEQFYFYSVGHLFYLSFQLGLPLLLWLISLACSRSAGSSL